MNTFVFLVLISASLAAAPKKPGAKLPSYAPNNPYGKWQTLPKGKNYLFCGDRILYGNDFSQKIAIIYNDGIKKLSLLEHCELRRRSLESSRLQNAATEPTLIELQYEKLTNYLKKIKKQDQKGRIYSFKDLQKAMKGSEINALRTANMLLPVLDKDSFGKLYVNDSNNAQFVTTEYERYASNLLTQNVAMLYTTDGSLYYFSLNLSTDHLKLLSSVLNSGGGGAGRSGQAGGSGGRHKGSPESLQRLRANEAVAETKQNPFEGYKTKQNALMVRPQATTLPIAMGVNSNATFVPYNFDVGKLQVSRNYNDNPNYNSIEKISPVVGMTANPSLSMLTNAPSRGVNNIRTYEGSSDTSSRNIASSGSMPSSSVYRPSETTNSLPKSTTPVAKAEEGITSGGPMPIYFQYSRITKSDLDITCEEYMWDLYVHYAFENPSGIDTKDTNYRCLPPTTAQFCGEGKASETYTKDCVDSKMKMRSCYQRLTEEVIALCNKYGLDVTTKDGIKTCAETLSAFACNKIPCDYQEEKGRLVAKRVQLYKDGADMFTTTGAEYIKPREDLEKISRLKGSQDFASPNGTTRIDIFKVLKNPLPPKLKYLDLEFGLSLITLYYKNNIADKCDFNKVIEGMSPTKASSD